jgi:protein O-GlcNAc transferase
MKAQDVLAEGYHHQQAGRLAEAQRCYEMALRIAPELGDAHALLGALYYQQEAFSAAAAAWQKTLQIDSHRTELLSNIGAALDQAGQPQAALEWYARAWQVHPEQDVALYNYASALHQAERSAEAIPLFETLLMRQPTHARARNNLGAALQRVGRYVEAETQFRQVLELQPSYRMARLNLVDVLKAQGLNGAAELVCEEGLALDPPQPALWRRLGFLQLQSGQPQQAVASFTAACQLSPGDASLWRLLGTAHHSSGDMRAAVAAHEEALRLNPALAEAAVHLGHARRELGEGEAALAAYERAYQLEPSDAARIRLATFVPVIYQDQADLARWRTRIEREVAALQGGPLAIVDPLTEIGSTQFYWAYQGLADRDLQQQMAALYRPLLPETVAPQTPQPAPGRLRVGFLSAFLYNHTITHYYAPFIELLPRDQVEVHLLAAPGMPHDGVTDRLTQAATLHTLPRDLAAARQQVADLHLDVLVYPDIGLEPFSYFMAFTRLAPRQCVLPGHPITTGIPTLDYFLSNDITEADDADDHYSETLVRLKGMPVSYRRPNLPAQPLSRAQLGWQEDRHYYVCPMTLFKIHPDWDQAIAEILRQDPLGEVVLFRYQQTELHLQLQTRFERGFPDVAARICFLPWAEPETFFSILMQADVLLDSFHFGGGSTHFLCLATGTPLVTWPGRFLRGRSGAAFYQRMGLPEAVATSQADFVHKAVTWACDRDQRQILKNAILANHHVLYENPEGCHDFVTWICQ